MFCTSLRCLAGGARQSRPANSRWPSEHEQIGDPTLADGILDRLVHNAHRIEMRGESMRKKRSGKE
jgi:DNA replication protein DnaC